MSMNTNNIILSVLSDQYDEMREAAIKDEAVLEDLKDTAITYHSLWETVVDNGVPANTLVSPIDRDTTGDDDAAEA